MASFEMDYPSISRHFYEIGEPFAGGFYEEPDRDRFFRFARAQRRMFELAPLPVYNGGILYPNGWRYPQPMAVYPDYSYTFAVQWDLLQEKWPQAVEIIREETDLLTGIGKPHNVGGDGYTHSIPRYERVVREGLDSYQLRVMALDDGDFRDGLLDVLQGIREFHRRSMEHLLQSGAPTRLLEALKQVPFMPARSLYEAIVCWNFIYYIDGCDNPGRLDAELINYYKGEDATVWLREFFTNVDQNMGWTAALGPDYNDLTVQCLKAIKGMRRPSLELRVTSDMPDAIWKASADALMSGSGQPAFYNERVYQSALKSRFPSIPEEDRLRFCGGGCTETMLAGLCNVGSLDAGINLPLIFEKHMRRNLPRCSDFSEYYESLLLDISAVIRETLERVNRYQKQRAAVRPHPIRTLLIDDCIDRKKDFNAGGARYYWSVINLSGLINVVDSLLAIRTLIYETGLYTPEDFLDKLEKQDPLFLRKARECPCFGVDNDVADQLAADFTERVVDLFDQITPWLGGQFLPSSIQFTTYVEAGKDVPATPDGRREGEPLADSIGAVHGKDTSGPTALLNSVAKLPLEKMSGTPVLNLRLKKDTINKYLKPLITGFFSQGGMQVQISCLSREDILDAMEHPEKHENLIVRVGGYSEYFNALSHELKQTILQRTEY